MARLGIEELSLESSRESPTQEQTRDAFAFKWDKRETYESASVQLNTRDWLFDRYCGGDPSILARWLAGDRQLILDAGCGSGFSALLFFGDHLHAHDYLGVDISDAVEVARVRFAEAGYPGEFLKRSILDLPIPDESVDLLFSEGVLHHTDDTRQALHEVARKVRPGGRILFYVYARKAEIREFTDDFVRENLRPLSDSEAWEALRPLTRLGKALGDLNIVLDVPEDIPFLGIKSGPIDIQRFFYWNICKLYYRPEYSLEEMNHINFDWFRPLNCHRQTPEQVSAWCEEADLAIESMKVEDAGITVVAVKRSVRVA